MQADHPIRKLFLIWLAWAVILIVYQAVVPMRPSLQRPDYALSWTPPETAPHSQDDKPYLNEPFGNAQVSWDSEFYLSIATVSYDDPAVRAILTDFSWDQPRYCVAGQDKPCYSLNYAFFPAYPYLARLIAFPPIFMALSHLGKNEVWDRGWILFSTLLMGLYATLFAFDMWAG